jgi:hypothetical protein
MLALMCCFAPLSVSATPADGLTDLTICYDADEPIEDAPFSIYYVAAVEDDGSIELTDNFSDAQITGVSAGDEDEFAGDDWTGLAATLESYILVENTEGNAINPVAEGLTDEDGRLDFDNLEQGIYLLTGETHEVGGESYVPTASLISLPYVHTDGTVDYSPEVIPKYELVASSTPNGQSELTDLSVQKIWKDNSSTKRPEKISVMLFQDGVEYDEVELNKDNSWYHTWKNLDKDSHWQLGEVSVPTGYTVLTEKEGSTFVVVNTLTTTTTTPHSSHGGRPKTTSTPQESTTEISVEATTEKSQDVSLPPFTPDDNSVNTPKTTDSPSEVSTEAPSEITSQPEATPPIITSNGSPASKLPQTGQLWWPIPLLAFGGIIAVMVGRKLKVSSEQASETGSELSSKSGSNDEK